MPYQDYISHLTDVQIPANQWLTNTLTPLDLDQFFLQVTKDYNSWGCWKFAHKKSKRFNSSYRTLIENNLAYPAFKPIDGKPIPAHRLSYVIHHHPIPLGSILVVDHLCMWKSCCNPQHLELVTQATNQQRAKEYYMKHTRKDLLNQIHARAHAGNIG